MTGREGKGSGWEKLSSCTTSGADAGASSGNDDDGVACQREGVGASDGGQRDLSRRERAHRRLELGGTGRNSW